MSTIVVKLGGAVGADAAALVASLARRHAVCVVHGAGSQISAELERRRLPVEFVHGRRLTTPAALAVVRTALREVGDSICAALGPAGVPLDGELIGLRATPLPWLGLVGEAVPSRPGAVTNALAAGKIPVVTPLARGPLNVNADDAAAALAIGLGADRLLFLTDVPGLLLGGVVARSIGAAEAERLLAGGTLAGGIVPKLRAAIGAVRAGVEATIGVTAVHA